ncbi:heterokaryon incompatibility protein-domain-containing protein [Apodospora peruviana]|uniref:Heterokaryon incompatibility protein-domain-containing protein n=1 Tax=Apodospora peruviana TaxID=516989 RepID=A0AAE0I1Z7_9PEZI|nr:heterokaryon incompatibility protein-domain-containing protein [Apodospora peruviana]
MTNRLYDRPLSKVYKEIRVIDITSWGEKDAVMCHLEAISLTTECITPFVALSYVWGDASDTAPITVNGETVLVTKTLAFALQWVKSHWEEQFPDRDPSSFRVWADGLCINQEDIHEKSDQVKLMSKIYKTAEAVFASVYHPNPDMIGFGIETVRDINRISDSLDEDESMWPTGWYMCPSLFAKPGQNDAPPDSPSTTLATLIAQMGAPDAYDNRNLLVDAHLTSTDIRDLRGREIMLAEMQTNERWSALAELLDADNWRRVWIYQEVVLSRQLFVFCGPYGSISDDDLEELGFRLRLERDMVHQVPIVQRNVSPETIRWPVWLRFTIANGANYRLFNLLLARDLVRSEEMRFRGAQMYETDGMQATNPRDYVYGLLGVTGLKMSVDYAKPVRRVYRDYVAASLGSQQSFMGSRLDFLRYAGLWRITDDTNEDIRKSESLKELPSWAPRSNSALRPRWILVDEALPKANAGFPAAEPPYIGDDKDKEDVLFSPGIIFGTIQATGPSFDSDPDTATQNRIFQYVCDLLKRHSSRAGPPSPSCTTSIPRAVFDLLGRHSRVGPPSCTTSIFRAVFRTFEFDHSRHHCTQQETLVHARHFISTLCTYGEVNGSMQETIDNLIRLGLPGVLPAPPHDECVLGPLFTPESYAFVWLHETGSDDGAAAAAAAASAADGRQVAPDPSRARLLVVPKQQERTQIDSQRGGLSSDRRANPNQSPTEWYVADQVARNESYVLAEITSRPSGSIQLAQVPRCARDGDVLCVLSEMDVPVVLRQVEDGDGYWYVGQAFVLDAMNGEVMNWWNDVSEKVCVIKIQ